VARAGPTRYSAPVMRPFVLIFVLLAAVFSSVAAMAGERTGANSPPPVIGPHPPIWRFNGPPQEPPFSRSNPAQAVWNDGSCWSACGAYCVAALNACLYNDTTQGSCVQNTDSCDLVCQRACRSDGGPFLPID